MALAFGAAALLWWGLTGLVFWLARRRPAAFPIIFGGSLGVFGAAFAGFAWASDTPTVAGVYCAFTCALLLWAFQELSFYLGYLTGPDLAATDRRDTGWRRFGRALKANIYHELSIILTLGVLALISNDGPSHFGLTTFAVIWAMHESARINVFLGVRNIHADWIPDHLSTMRPFLKEAPSNDFFPLSVALIAGLGLYFGHLAVSAQPGSGAETGYTLLATLTALALIEHLCLILPIPIDKLWRVFGVPQPDAAVQHFKRGETV